MLQIYLPIAEMSLSVPLLALIGGCVGVLSGLFGISGGFLITPLLIFLGVPPPIAVGTQATQSVASASAGMLAHRSRRNVDMRLGLFMLGGSAIGTSIGSLIFGWLQRIGQIDFVIALLYVVFLGSIGSVMMIESSRAIMRRRSNPSYLPAPRQVPRLLQRLPLKVQFPVSGLEISMLVPISIGLIAGITTVILGLGGTLLVPAMIYLLAMPAAMVAGTSLLQVVFTASAATMLQAVNHHTVDVVLALALMIGSVFGSQIGARYAVRMRPDIARCLMAVIILVVAIRLGFELTLPPDPAFSWEVVP